MNFFCGSRGGNAAAAKKIGCAGPGCPGLPRRPEQGTPLPRGDPHTNPGHEIVMDGLFQPLRDNLTVGMLYPTARKKG